jgi:hypothetical protein
VRTNLKPNEGRYDRFGWRVAAKPGDVSAGRLTETHEYFHRQLDETTAFGGLTTTAAALADALPDDVWSMRRDRLEDMSDLVHASSPTNSTTVHHLTRLDFGVATSQALAGMRGSNTMGVQPWPQGGHRS